MWLDNSLIGVVKDGNLYYVETDQLGSPRTVIQPGYPSNDPTQGDKVVWKWDYAASAFGENAPNEDPDGDGAGFVLNMRYPGQYFDTETGLHYNYRRDYDPTTGRYIESDPAGVQAAINTYAYVDSNPLAWTDTRGLAKDKIVQRWSKCPSKDEEQCRQDCQARGREFESCRRRWILGTEIAGGEVVQGWVPAGLSCIFANKTRLPAN